jgi:hypothetical protein
LPTTTFPRWWLIPLVVSERNDWSGSRSRRCGRRHHQGIIQRSSKSSVVLILCGSQRNGDKIEVFWGTGWIFFNLFLWRRRKLTHANNIPIYTTCQHMQHANICNMPT